MRETITGDYLSPTKLQSLSKILFLYFLIIPLRALRLCGELLRMEGNHCYNPSSDCDTSGLTLPIWEYRHEDHGNCSITGGYVYRGAKFSELYGKYIYGDYCSGRIWALSYDGTNTATNTLLLKEDIEISSFGIDEDNELYICDLNGKVYKLAYKE